MKKKEMVTDLTVERILFYLLACHFFQFSCKTGAFFMQPFITSLALHPSPLVITSYKKPSTFCTLILVFTLTVYIFLLFFLLLLNFYRMSLSLLVFICQCRRNWGLGIKGANPSPSKINIQK